MNKYLTKSLFPAIKYFLMNHYFNKSPFWFIRKWYLTNVMKIRIGSDSYIGMDCFITGDKIEIGRNTVINRGCYLDGRMNLRIGNNVNISNYTYIQTVTHDPQKTDFSCLLEPVEIEDNVWIGARAIILTGVKIGEGSVIGAGAVVTKNIPSYSIAVGCPAKVIKKRNKKIDYSTRFFPIFDTDIQ